MELKTRSLSFSLPIRNVPSSRITSFIFSLSNSRFLTIAQAVKGLIFSTLLSIINNQNIDVHEFKINDGYSYANNEYAKTAYIIFELINKKQFVKYIDITSSNVNEVEMKIAGIISRMSTHIMYTTLDYITGTIINSDLNDIL